MRRTAGGTAAGAIVYVGQYDDVSTWTSKSQGSSRANDDACDGATAAAQHAQREPAPHRRTAPRRTAPRTSKISSSARDASTSLNMPSSFAVKLDPHSVFSLEINAFSRSLDALLFSSRRLARSCGVGAMR